VSPQNIAVAGQARWSTLFCAAPAADVSTAAARCVPAPESGRRRAALPGIIRRMEERVEREAAPAAAATFWTSTYLLMGLCYPRELAVQLLQGVRAMKESTTYQAILEEGGANELRKVLLLLGDQRFGPPDTSVRARIEETADLARLERWTARLLKASSWEELLAAS
jgi:hypothetical protein